MIQTEIRNDRGDLETLDHNDPRYWEGPYRYEPYPKMLFKATAGAEYTNPQAIVVKNEQERSRLGSGWCESPDDARAFADKLDAEMAAAAAERNAADLKLSAKAQAEALAIDRATDDMVPDIPAPKKRGGRPRKVKPEGVQ